MTALGLGTYRSRDAERAARIAAAAGCPLIDTAPVYGRGTHQPELAPVLEQHPQVRIATKVGHMTAEQAKAAMAAGALSADQASQRYSIAPDYLHYRLALSAHELGRARLDLAYLHNPDHHHDGDRTALHGRIRAAFTALEQARHQGLITGYGVATWSGFADDAFSVADLLTLAREAADSAESGLVAVQMPVSLVEIDPLSRALNGSGPTVQADAAGLEVWASAPLHGGELTRLVNDQLARFIAPGLSGAQAALLVTASTPGVSGVLVTASSAEHWNSATEALAHPHLPTSRLKEISALLTRTGS